ncbi:LacI family DNA-binding transcriptional regulator [Actinomyces procaprae]|uniref:LacI family DNA-binding transcriptional regulator n=1 Tax=Actinomyces procaprae TaxID=2560010 RepID=UPI00249224F8|nr:LacI family DNA-binding transcriptional regulator [Actinomyces procaprae]
MLLCACSCGRDFDPLIGPPAHPLEDTCLYARPGRSLVNDSQTQVSGARRVTLADVAAQAGVSMPTASKALNNRADVAEATRQQVLEVAQRLGYSPPPSRRPLQLPAIALVAQDLRSAYALSIIDGAAEASRAVGAVIAVTSANIPAVSRSTLQPLSEQWFIQLHRRDYLGVITTTTRLSVRQVSAAADNHLPVVSIDPTSPLPHGVVPVQSANWEGALTATEHLIGLGHRRIAVIGGPPASIPAQDRFRGFLTAMRNHGLSPDRRLAARGAYVVKTGYLAGRQWFAMPPDERPTAVFAGADACAIGVHRAAHDTGLAVPEDLSIVGFDDVDIAAWTTPPLTTVQQPLKEMASEAVRIILARRQGDESVSHPVSRFPTRLIVRRSTTAPPSSR